jgi:hypothetical protein
MFAGKESYAEELAEGKAIKAGKISPKQYAQRESKEPAPKMACGGKVKKYAEGGAVTRGCKNTVRGTKFNNGNPGES